jgi:hypothetical protein
MQRYLYGLAEMPSSWHPGGVRVPPRRHPADRYCPRDPVLRGQMATFLAYAGGYGW